MPQETPQVLPEGVNPDYVVLVDGVYYDRCVFCRKNSQVRTDCPVDNRMYYIRESGQLCAECWDMTQVF